MEVLGVAFNQEKALVGAISVIEKLKSSRRFIWSSSRYCLGSSVTMPVHAASSHQAPSSADRSHHGDQSRGDTLSCARIFSRQANWPCCSLDKPPRFKHSNTKNILISIYVSSTFYINIADILYDLQTIYTILSVVKWPNFLLAELKYMPVQNL